MKKSKWLTVERSKVYDYPRERRFIVTTYKLLGFPILKRVIPWT